MQRITTLERFLAPTGRIIVGVFFILAGFSRLADTSGTAAYISSINLHNAAILAIIAALIEIIGGFMLLTGFKGRCASLILALFVLVATFPFHGPHTWSTDTTQQVLFMKNVALFGALLFMAAHINRVSNQVDRENEQNRTPRPTL